MLPKYRFYLKTDSEVGRRLTFPVWKDDLSIEWKMESGQMFHRSELSGSIDFIGTDYDYIMSKTFGVLFRVEIEISDNGESWSHYWRGKFSLTDCKVNIDDRTVTVKPQTVDSYTDILSGLDNEYDLIKLLPEIEKLRLTKRPAIQIFDTASDMVTTICGNISFEQEANLPVDNVMQFLRETCHFASIRSEVEIRIYDGPDSNFDEPFVGTITGDGSVLSNGGSYFIRYFESSVPFGLVRYGLAICSYAQPDDVKWLFEDFSAISLPGLPSSIDFEAQHALDADLHGGCNEHGLYSRVICNTDTYSGGFTEEIQNGDIVSYNRNYRRCYPYNAGIMIQTTEARSSTPTIYGIDDSGNYYTPPSGGGEYIPIGRNLWGRESIWVHKTTEYINIEQYSSHKFWLNDAYPLYSCIQRLLAKIDPTIYFGNTSDYSRFLYSGSDPLQGRDNRLYITPKTNITNGEYETPAQTAPITLRDILDMLKNVYKCYWFIEYKQIGGVWRNCLRIEHVQFFINGGTYSPNPSTRVGIDLTEMINIRNFKSWAFGTNEYEFEKMDMPERFQFEWMDEVTSIFKGQPIIVESNIVEKDKIEEINVANFTSDVDYMMLNPSAISPDGFALLNPNIIGGVLELPVVTGVYYEGFTNRVQNAFLSYHLLQTAYWRYDMPDWTLNIEGEVNSATRALSVSRNKKQTVNVPVGMPTQPNGEDLDLNKLIKTWIGEGQIYQASIRLTTRVAKIQLRYESE